LCFRALNDRIIWLEKREAGQAPSDEQVERVLRKILAEKCTYTQRMKTRLKIC
jgi:hypothetical protein